MKIIDESKRYILEDNDIIIDVASRDAESREATAELYISSTVLEHFEFEDNVCVHRGALHDSWGEKSEKRAGYRSKKILLRKDANKKVREEVINILRETKETIETAFNSRKPMPAYTLTLSDI